MLSLLVVSFLFGCIGWSLGIGDLSTLSFILIIYLLSIIFIKKNFGSKINFLKDMSFMSFILSFIILVPSVFYFGIYWSSSRILPVSYLQFTKTEVELEGVVVDREMRNDRQILSLRLEQVTDASSNKYVDLGGEYVNLPVSMFQEFKLYERLRVKAKTEPENWREVSVVRPLFYRYETDAFLKSRAFSVSPYGMKIERLPYETTLLEKIFRNLKELKLSFIKILQTYLSEPYSSLASGITLGESSSLSKDTQDAMRQSGLVHMMVLSGANISFIIGMIWILSRRMSVRIRVVSVLGVAWVFILMTGLSAPALRAGAMATLAILAESTGRPQLVVRGLLLVLGLETLLDPEALIYSSSLHLSFLACFGLFIVAPVLANSLQTKFCLKSKLISNLVGLVLGVWLSTSIYILGMSGSVNVFGGLLTLIAEPVVALSTILTFLTIAAQFTLPILSEMISFFNTFLLQIFLYLAELGANHLPQITVSVGRGFVILYYLIFINVSLIYFYKIKNNEQIKFLEESLLLRK